MARHFGVATVRPSAQFGRGFRTDGPRGGLAAGRHVGIERKRNTNHRFGKGRHASRMATPGPRRTTPRIRPAGPLPSAPLPSDRAPSPALPTPASGRGNVAATSASPLFAPRVRTIDLVNANAPAPRRPSPAPPDVDQRLLDDWKRRVAALTDPMRALLAEVCAAGGPAVADHFYGDMLEDPRASRYLSLDQVRERLMPSLQRWLRDLLAAAPEDLDTLYALQQHVGQVHARIGVPVDLVNRGGRMLKDGLRAGIRARAADDATALEAIIVVDSLLDIAFETMTRAYARSRDDAGAIDGSFRLFSLIQNIGTERERQRALLLAWENAVLYALTADQPGPAQALLIGRSEFGLWFVHKGLASFGDTAETREVGAICARIDAALRERLAGADATARRALLEDLRAWAEQIRSLVGMLFEGIGDLESGRDALTRLLNRRFLPTILRREISLEANTGRQFAVLMIDLDHFKAINDRHGHETGDRALQHVAALLVDNTRGS